MLRHKLMLRNMEMHLLLRIPQIKFNSICSYCYNVELEEEGLTSSPESRLISCVVILINKLNASTVVELKLCDEQKKGEIKSDEGEGERNLF